MVSDLVEPTNNTFSSYSNSSSLSSLINLWLKLSFLKFIIEVNGKILSTNLNSLVLVVLIIEFLIRLGFSFK
jgi:hypothetical protein